MIFKMHSYKVTIFLILFLSGVQGDETLEEICGRAFGIPVGHKMFLSYGKTSGQKATITSSHPAVKVRNTPEVQTTATKIMPFVNADVAKITSEVNATSTMITPIDTKIATKSTTISDVKLNTVTPASIIATKIIAHYDEGTATGILSAFEGTTIRPGKTTTAKIMPFVTSEVKATSTMITPTDRKIATNITTISEVNPNTVNPAGVTSTQMIANIDEGTTTGIHPAINGTTIRPVKTTTAEIIPFVNADVTKMTSEVMATTTMIMPTDAKVTTNITTISEMNPNTVNPTGLNVTQIIAHDDEGTTTGIHPAFEETTIRPGKTTTAKIMPFGNADVAKITSEVKARTSLTTPTDRKIATNITTISEVNPNTVNPVGITATQMIAHDDEGTTTGIHPAFEESTIRPGKTTTAKIMPFVNADVAKINSVVEATLTTTTDRKIATNITTISEVNPNTVNPVGILATEMIAHDDEGTTTGIHPAFEETTIRPGKTTTAEIISFVNADLAKITSEVNATAALTTPTNRKIATNFTTISEVNPNTVTPAGIIATQMLAHDNGTTTRIHPAINGTTIHPVQTTTAEIMPFYNADVAKNSSEVKATSTMTTPSDTKIAFKSTAIGEVNPKKVTSAGIIVTKMIAHDDKGTTTGIHPAINGTTSRIHPAIKGTTIRPVKITTAKIIPFVKPSVAGIISHVNSTTRMITPAFKAMNRTVTPIAKATTSVITSTNKTIGTAKASDGKKKVLTMSFGDKAITSHTVKPSIARITSAGITATKVIAHDAKGTTTGIHPAIKGTTIRPVKTTTTAKIIPFVKSSVAGIISEVNSTTRMITPALKAINITVAPLTKETTSMIASTNKTIGTAKASNDRKKVLTMSFGDKAMTNQTVKPSIARITSVGLIGTKMIAHDAKRTTTGIHPAINGTTTGIHPAIKGTTIRPVKITTAKIIPFVKPSVAGIISHVNSTTRMITPAFKAINRTVTPTAKETASMIASTNKAMGPAKTSDDRKKILTMSFSVFETTTLPADKEITRRTVKTTTPKFISFVKSANAETNPEVSASDTAVTPAGKESASMITQTNKENNTMITPAVETKTILTPTDKATTVMSDHVDKVATTVITPAGETNTTIMTPTDKATTVMSAHVDKVATTVMTPADEATITMIIPADKATISGSTNTTSTEKPTSTTQKQVTMDTQTVTKTEKPPKVESSTIHQEACDDSEVVLSNLSHEDVAKINAKLHYFSLCAFPYTKPCKKFWKSITCGEPQPSPKSNQKLTRPLSYKVQLEVASRLYSSGICKYGHNLLCFKFLSSLNY